ncbi:hypothetical protein [Cryobacterium roopkundense]|uniref:Glycosyl transferase family 1 domain-containing protein n=1 Tax=Cryobacterium roopkundense TaxID=1001240 RepID=A0A7W9E5P1_9MICO|nr:hypothetical protein [Cryobacterium roopkundense]MBB5642160.1 hypothetical protein [Cryobacterium roopkundense]
MYAAQYRHSGSTVMRGAQLSAIAAQSMPDRDVKYVELNVDIRNSVVFLTKGALKAMTMERLESLKKHKNVLLFDVVDELPPPITHGYADVLIAASHTAFVQHSINFPHLPVRLVNHHVDPRVSALQVAPPDDRLRTAYFGETINAIFTSMITETVQVVPIDTSRQSSSWIDHLAAYNLHYAVRATRDLDNYKPFLKGFTAAHCDSNILIQATEAEPAQWLGTDYPFLVQGPATEASILAAIEHARGCFGGPEWNQGLVRMREVRERTSPERIGAEVRSACAV